MRVLDIVPGTSVDGPGLRTSIYFAGCTHACPQCHNPQSWDAEGGREMTVEDIMQIVEENGFDVTFSGGDPLFQAPAILPLAKELRNQGYGIWCYTGYCYEAIASDPVIAQVLECCDVLVDGPFLVDQRDVGLLFRGSRNQRMIDLHKSTTDAVCLWSPEPDVF